MANPKRRRLNLNLTESVHARLQNLQNLTEADNVTEVIRNAVAYYDFLVQNQNAGKRIVIKNDDGSEETLHLLS